MHELGGDPEREIAGSQSCPAGNACRVVAKIRPSGPTISTASSATKRPRTSVTPAGRREASRSVRARCAPESTTRVPEAPTANAIHSLRAGSLRSCGRKLVPTPGSRATAAWTTPGREASAITTATPDHVAILAAASLDTIPPLPRAPPGPAICSSSWSISVTSSMSDASAARRGSELNSPGVSVSNTSSSAETRWATRAASLSLSPKRISSSDVASFSFTTGTTSSCRSRSRVWRAWRY